MATAKRKATKATDPGDRGRAVLRAARAVYEFNEVCREAEAGGDLPEFVKDRLTDAMGAGYDLLNALCERYAAAAPGD